MSQGNWKTGPGAANPSAGESAAAAVARDIAKGEQAAWGAASQAAATSPDADSRVDKRKTRAKLDSAQEVRFELARLYRQARNGKVDVSDASKLAHMLSILSRVIETSDIEKRIEQLEQRKGK